MAGMSTKEQTIHVVIDNSQAMERDAAFARQYQANAQARTKADQDAAKDSTKADAQSAKDRAALNQELNKLLAQSEKDQAKWARESANERVKANQAVNKLLADLKRDEIRDAQATAKAAAQANQEREKSDRDYVKAKRMEANAIAQADKENEKSQHGVNDAIMGGVKSAGMFAAAMIGVGSAGQVLNAVLERFELLRTRALEESGKMTAEATDLRKLSALEGNLGAPSLTQASQLKLRAQTLQTAGESEQMTTAAKASAFGAIAAGRVSKEDFDKFLISQGRLQTLTHADAKAVGQAAGLMPMITGKDKNSAAELENLSGRLYEIQKLGGFEDYGQASKQLGESAGYVMKGIYSAPEVQALQSAFAMGGEGNTASERLTQLTRATSANMMRNRKMKLGADYQENSATSYEYFKQLGINDQTAPIDRAMRIVKDVQTKEDEAKKAGKEFYGTDYLATRGFNSVQDREAILKLVGVSRTGLMDQLLEKAKAPIGESSEVQSAWKTMTSDPVFQKRASDLMTEAENKGFGTGPGGVKIFENQMLERAYAQTGGVEGNAGYDLEQIKDRWRLDPRNWGNMKGSLSNLEWEAQHSVLSAARQAGIETPGVMRIDAKTGAETGENWLGWEKLMELNQQAVAAGGKGALGDNTDKLAKSMDRLSENLEKYVKGPGGPKDQPPGTPTAAKPPLTQSPGRI
jgi:hypothetical protein